jgi:hypothetical protein
MMMTPARARFFVSAAVLCTLVAAIAAAGVVPARAADGRAENTGQSVFPAISFRAFPGVVDAVLQDVRGRDSVVVRTVSRKVTIRWARDREAEARNDFGGYRIYRQTTVRDTTNMELVRRFAVFARSPGDTLPDGSHSAYAHRDTLLWYFPDDQDTLQFVDPDSAGNLVKVCRTYDEYNRCTSPGDSVFALVPPGQPPGRPDFPAAGPHDGFPIYYTIVYGSVDQTRREVADMFVPDLFGTIRPCDPADPASCANLNNKALNLMVDPVYVTGPAQPNVESVIVVPNPYRGSERWDEPGGGRIQFQNLPAVARVRVYTIAGDLVADLSKSDAASGSLDWNLKNGAGNEVASGIYVYHVESSEGFEAKGNFVVIR